MTQKGRRLELRALAKHYGAQAVVDDVSFTIEPGRFVSLLGPSGCGKTTTLRMIAGFEQPDAGAILLDGAPLHPVPVHKRNIGIVFQDHALFPHRTVAQNVAFGLKQRKISRPDIARRTAAALDVVRLADFAGRYPAQLSGGQRQRVAIARAIVIEPDLLLFDEPLSALDASLRDELRGELKRLQHGLGISTLFVTHDQSEALSLSDRVVVMNRGRVEQQGTPEALYRHPHSAFVAGFFGELNPVVATLLGHENGQLDVQLGCGSEIRLATTTPPPAGARLCLRSDAARIDADSAGQGLRATVLGSDYLGMLVRYRLAACGGELAVVQPHGGSIHPDGSAVRLVVGAQNWTLIDDRGEVHGH